MTDSFGASSRSVFQRRRCPLFRSFYSDNLDLCGSMIQPVIVGRSVLDFRLFSTDTIETVVGTIDDCFKSKVRRFMIFYIPSRRDDFSLYCEEYGALLRSIHDLYGGDILVIADICHCMWQSNRSCRISSSGIYDSDTMKKLCQIAICCAQGGAQCVAPSGVLDGQVSSLRFALDSKGLESTCIIPYSVKLRSELYKSFRESCGGGSFTSQRWYQHSIQSRKECYAAIDRDVLDEADCLIIKPSSLTLDLCLYASSYDTPVISFQVLSEWFTLISMSEDLNIPLSRLFFESFFSLKRSGVQSIICYGAKNVLDFLENSGSDLYESI